MRYIFLVRVDEPDHYTVHSVWDDRAQAVEQRDQLNRQPFGYNARVEVWALGMGTFGKRETLLEGDE